MKQALNGAKPRGRLKAPDVYASLRQSPAPTDTLTRDDHTGKPVPTRLRRNTGEPCHEHACTAPRERQRR